MGALLGVGEVGEVVAQLAATSRAALRGRRLLLGAEAGLLHRGVQAALLGARRASTALGRPAGRVNEPEVRGADRDWPRKARKFDETWH